MLSEQVKKSNASSDADVLAAVNKLVEALAKDKAAGASNVSIQTDCDGRHCGRCRRTYRFDWNFEPRRSRPKRKHDPVAGPKEALREMSETSINTTVENGAVVGVAGAERLPSNSRQTSEPSFSTLQLASQSPAPEPTGPIPPCPYPGLAYFGPQDATRFFGREKAIQALIGAVAKRSFTALVGASGSGKSSVVLAGLAPRLDHKAGARHISALRRSQTRTRFWRSPGH